ncbi:hypothetical protein F2Q68_00041204 [Brassica cretica]|uniref:Uncharacterized protein n=1 Tax=Brassica cretica TaxID=69181 RepID=A0A8S9MK55_BRACR|nr:hypothetical protein F2Q68_00041204 [Brassica cretica]
MVCMRLGFRELGNRTYDHELTHWGFGLLPYGFDKGLRITLTSSRRVVLVADRECELKLRSSDREQAEVVSWGMD